MTIKRIGKIHHNINVSEEYRSLAMEDETAARFLKSSSQYRHSIYFFIQAMEKNIRSKIFTLVNPNNEYFRKKNQNHSLSSAVDFLIEIISSNELIKNQIKKQLNDILQEINFQFLHNNLRYPFYIEKHDNYSIIEFTLEDCLFIENMNEVLKKYLSELSRLS